MGRMGQWRLLLALCCSVLIHLLVIDSLSPGVPGIGLWHRALQGSSHQFDVLILAGAVKGADDGQPAATLAELESTAADFSLAKAHESSFAEDAAATSSAASRLGLLPEGEFGPPYPPPAPAYFPSDELDHQPRLLTELDTSFPEVGNIAGAGRMIFILLIDETGQVDETLNEFSSLDRNFVGVVQASLNQMRFAPGMKSDRPVKARVRIEVNFGYSVYGPP